MARKHNERFRGREEITIFGRRAVMEALTCADVSVLKIAAAREIVGSFGVVLGRAAADAGLELEFMGPREISRLSADARNDQGVVARIALKKVSPLTDFLSRQSAAARLIALDNVTNPQNVGMIVRSAVGAGLAGMLWPLAGSPWVSGLVIKSSASAIYRCPIVTTPSLAEGLGAMKQAGFSVVGLAAGKHPSLFEHRPRTRAVYIVGSETEGLSPETEALLDERLSIPMSNQVESLNVAVAASLVCFHVAHAR